MPFVVYLLLVGILTSVKKIDPMEGMKIIDEFGNTIQEESNTDKFAS